MRSGTRKFVGFRPQLCKFSALMADAALCSGASVEMQAALCQSPNAGLEELMDFDAEEIGDFIEIP